MERTYPTNTDLSKLKDDTYMMPIQNMSGVANSPKVIEPLAVTNKKDPACKSPYRSIDARNKAKESRKARIKQKMATRMKVKRHKRKNK